MKFGDINWAALISGYKAEEKRQEEEKRKREQEEVNKRLIEARITSLTRPKEQDMGKMLLDVLAGFKQPETLFTPKQLEALPETRQIFPQGREMVVPGPGGLPITGLATEAMGRPEGGELLDMLKQAFPAISEISPREAVRKRLGLSAEKETPPLTPAQALTILSDPFKSQHIKRTQPNLYKKLEDIVKEAFGEDVLNKVTPTGKSNILDTNW